MSQLQPKPRRRLLTVVSITFALFAIGLLVGKIIEDKRGFEAWQDYRDSVAARGEPLEWKDHIPAPIADEENFALAPVIADEERLAALDLRELPHFGPLRRIPDWTVAQEVTLSSYFQDPAGPLDEEGAMSALEKAFAEWDATLADVAEASRLPKSRFPLAYAEGTGMGTESLEALVRVRLVFELRSLWRLRQSDAEGALDDFGISIKLAEHLASIPGLGSHAMRSSAIMGSLQTVWEGLRDRAWDEGQLARLADLLNGISLTRSYFTHLKQERAMALDVLERYAQGRPVEDEENMPIRRVRFFPEGWYYQNMVSLCEQMDRFFFRAGGVERDEPDAAEALGAMEVLEQDSSDWFRFYHVHVDTLMYFFVRMTQFVIQQQSFVEMARVAVALERFRLVEDHYPDALNALVPRFLDAIPTDRLSGEELAYGVKENGTPLLYSVGINQVDDGGTPGKQLEEGDWVWQYDFPAFLAEDSP